MKKYLLFSIILLTQQAVYGQSGKLRRADTFYKTLAYSLAAENYEALLGTPVDGPAMQAKLANCYAKLGWNDKAEAMYARMISSSAATPNDLFQYAQVLKQNGKDEESDAWMKKFLTVRNTDSRAVEYKNDQNYRNTIAAQGVYFDVHPLNVNTAYTEFGAYPAADGKSVYFLTSRGDKALVKRSWMWNEENFLDVFKGTLAANQEIEQPQALDKSVNTPFHEGPLCFAPNGSKVYFTRNNLSKGSERKDDSGIQNLKLYMAEVLPDGSWTNESEVAFNSRAYSVGHPSISADGQFLYFASDMPGGFGGADIYKAEIRADGTLGSPSNLGGKVNSEGQEMFPWISPQGQLFFSSDGHMGLGGLDVFVAVMDDDGKLSKLLNAGAPLNSRRDDFAFTMNADGQHGYISSNRPGGKGADDIYAFTLIKPFKTKITLTGFVQDKENNVMTDAIIDLIDEEGMVVQTTTSNQIGMYSFDVKEGLNYQIAVRKPEYFGMTTAVSTIGLPSGTDNITQDVELERDPGMGLYILVRSKTSEQPLEGVRVKVVDAYSTKEVINGTTPSTGDLTQGIANKKMGDLIAYTITLEKEGYLAKTVMFASTVAQPGVINVHETIDLTMDKIEVGGDLAKMVDLKPIYFDLGKFIIRADAAKELDKIVDIMNKYPTMEVELGSHTDCRGSKEANQTLSGNRAGASAAYIRARITNPDRIQGRGYGETRLKNDCGCEGAVKSTCSETEHQENRRTEFIILKM